MADTLVILRHAPYGSGLARAAVDATLAAGAFEQAVSILFLGDGVLCLLPGQDGHSVGSRDLDRVIASLPLTTSTPCTWTRRPWSATASMPTDCPRRCV